MPTGHQRIRWGARIYESISYRTERETVGIPAAPMNDIAMIVMAANPWSPDKRLLVVAGVRGFGTCGAAHFLNTGWRKLYSKLHFLPPGISGQSVDFAALLNISYHNYDLGEIEILDVEMLKRKKVKKNIKN